MGKRLKKDDNRQRPKFKKAIDIGIFLIAIWGAFLSTWVYVAQKRDEAPRIYVRLDVALRGVAEDGKPVRSKKKKRVQVVPKKKKKKKSKRRRGGVDLKLNWASFLFNFAKKKPVLASMIPPAETKFLSHDEILLIYSPERVTLADKVIENLALIEKELEDFYHREIHLTVGE